MSDTRKYGERYDRYVESFEPGLVRNDGSYVMPPSYEEFEAEIEAEAVRRWPLKIGDKIVYLDGLNCVSGVCYSEYSSPHSLNVKGERWLEYDHWGGNLDFAPQYATHPTAMRLLPGEKPPKDHIAAMAMIAREAKKHKWIENYKKWR